MRDPATVARQGFPQPVVCASRPRVRYAARMDGYLGSYATLGLILLVGVLVFVAAFGANRLLSPANPAEPAGKRVSYESGVDPVGGDWAQAQIRYYVYAYLYVLFAVEAVFLFPWAVVFDRPGFGLVTVAEMGLFVAVLALGILYAWRKKILTWT
jgi:NADH-quinone oxidoreductase subunit A